jgi:DNA-binding transcriptional LysR family regulator
MERRHLRHYVAMAEELNVRQAATGLNLLQPPLSRQIYGLEDEVGTQLFVRRQSGMLRTEASRTFLKEARSILSQSRRAEAEETDELVAAVDEGIQAAEEGRVFSLEEIKMQMQSWITK